MHAPSPRKPSHRRAVGRHQWIPIGAAAAAALTGAATVASALLVACSPPVLEERIETPLWAHPGGCAQCHEIASEEFELRAEPRELCSMEGCHESFEEEPPYLHGPVAVGECLPCHRPHSSAMYGLLTSADPDLCSSCHARLLTCPVAELFESTRCASCHEPHGGEDLRMLRPGAESLPAGTPIRFLPTP